MPEQETIERARKDKREGKSPSTQAGEFVREEIHHIREGKHGARSTKQAIAIGLSKARRAGVRLKPPQSAPAKTRQRAEQDYEKGQSRSAKPTSSKRSRSTSRALRREGKKAASHQALSRHARASLHRRGAAARSASARKAAKTRNH
jgi:uncharacterized protein DUF6496